MPKRTRHFINGKSFCNSRKIKREVPGMSRTTIVSVRLDTGRSASELPNPMRIGNMRGVQLRTEPPLVDDVGAVDAATDDVAEGAHAARAVRKWVTVAHSYRSFTTATVDRGPMPSTSFASVPSRAWMRRSG